MKRIVAVAISCLWLAGIAAHSAEPGGLPALTQLQHDLLEEQPSRYKEVHDHWLDGDVAEQLLKDLYGKQVAQFGKDSGQCAQTWNEFGKFYRLGGRHWDKSAQAFNELLRIRTLLLGPTAVDSAEALFNKLKAMVQLDQLPQAQAIAADYLQRAQGSLRAQTSDSARVYFLFINAYLERLAGHPAAAEKFLTEALALKKGDRYAQMIDPTYTQLMCEQCECLFQLGRPDEALAVARAFVPKRAGKTQGEDERMVALLTSAAAVFDQRGQPAVGTEALQLAFYIASDMRHRNAELENSLRAMIAKRNS